MWGVYDHTPPLLQSQVGLTRPLGAGMDHPPSLPQPLDFTCNRLDLLPSLLPPSGLPPMLLPAAQGQVSSMTALVAAVSRARPLSPTHRRPRLRWSRHGHRHRPRCHCLRRRSRRH